MSWGLDMGSAVDAATIALLAAGIVFFVAGTVGLLRFPDVHSRLHALTKADNLGLGFITVALLLQAPDAWKAVKMLFVWLLTMLAAATVAQLFARSALVARPPQDRRP
ncbi:monovalent cation/H(+) antiporter subunit G [Rhodopseudomonas palustris]|uniref:cation:proton antiporter n=1 Tax=Rhodopseudomonas palustris TaxID=1076 RepID=UPI002ACDF664|nr:monovalent cation/H(+) antiporter subunit G [Rhodopseudomonas palustris]WQG99788.1 monovalent cation/H(+) antiporter subunit G [Rhodopseudomonas palustris]